MACDADLLYMVRKGQNNKNKGQAKEKHQNKSSRKAVKRLASQMDGPIDSTQSTIILNNKSKRRKSVSKCM